MTQTPSPKFHSPPFPVLFPFPLACSIPIPPNSARESGHSKLYFPSEKSEGTVQHCQQNQKSSYVKDYQYQKMQYICKNVTKQQRAPRKGP